MRLKVTNQNGLSKYFEALDGNIFIDKTSYGRARVKQYVNTCSGDNLRLDFETSVFSTEFKEVQYTSILHIATYKVSVKDTDYITIDKDYVIIHTKRGQLLHLPIDDYFIKIV